MESGQFWQIIEESRRSPDQDERLGELLEALSAEEVAAFAARFRQCLVELYSWDLWGVGYLLQGGMGDDGFEYFRSFVISRGRRDFELALSDPESFGLSVVDLEEDERDREEFAYVAMDVYEDLTGEDLPDSGVRHPADPSGEEWPDEDALELRFPRLAARL